MKQLLWSGAVLLCARTSLPLWRRCQNCNSFRSSLCICIATYTRWQWPALENSRLCDRRKTKCKECLLNSAQIISTSDDMVGVDSMANKRPRYPWMQQSDVTLVGAIMYFCLVCVPFQAKKDNWAYRSMFQLIGPWRAGITRLIHTHCAWHLWYAETIVL